MNEYKSRAEAYRELVESGECTLEEVESKIKVLDFLATLTKEEIYEMVDTDVFNNIIKAYCLTALTDAKASGDVVRSVMAELTALFDEKGVTAKEVYENWIHC